YEKFRSGYLPKCGDPALKYMRKAEVHVQLKPGIFGVKVRIMPPDAKFPDKIQIVETLPQVEETEKASEETEKADSNEEGAVE
ncbi:MAG: 30S ribosomal protein S3, partial [Candidatus Bathyarchaeia archaeon]